jgi:bifunctional DNase/RNase
MSKMRVVGIRVEQPQNEPVLFLREATGERYLPIWIGQAEAAAIVIHQRGTPVSRPLTHDLLQEVITALGHELREVRITDLQEGTFFADLVFSGGVHVSARPSDSVALAMRAGVPIYADEKVLAEAGLFLSEEEVEVVEGSSAEPDADVPEEELAKFKEFLDSVSPGDFTAPEGE